MSKTIMVNYFAQLCTTNYTRSRKRRNSIKQFPKQCPQDYIHPFEQIYTNMNRRKEGVRRDPLSIYHHHHQQFEISATVPHSSYYPDMNILLNYIYSWFGIQSLSYQQWAIIMYIFPTYSLYIQIPSLWSRRCTCTNTKHYTNIVDTLCNKILCAAVFPKQWTLPFWLFYNIGNDLYIGITIYIYWLVGARFECGIYGVASELRIYTIGVRLYQNPSANASYY